MKKCLFISKIALEYNIDYYKRKTNKEIIAIVKNNAYGHGIKEVVGIIDNKIKMYGVSSQKEASEVLNYSKKDILILDKIDDYNKLEDNMIITIISKKQLIELIKLDKELRVHLKINISMKRKGVEENEVRECIELIEDSKLKLEGIYTHYSSYKIKRIKKQFARFKNVLKDIDTSNLIIHASSSVSSLILDEDVSDAIRVGIGMYGLRKINKRMNNLKIVGELKCSVDNIYKINNLDRFGYDNRYFGKKGYIVMINMGYGDGLFFNKKIRGYIDNGYIREIGIRNMNNTFFYSQSYIMDNSMIEIYGKNNKLDDLAKKLNISVYRLISLLNKDIEKMIIE